MSNYTEKEASNKWCPFSRVALLFKQKDDYLQADVVAGGGSFNRNPLLHPAFDDGALCVGSRCMAWQWSTERGESLVETRSLVGGDANKLPSRPGHRWHSQTAVHGVVEWGLFPIKGYCGLARKS